MKLGGATDSSDRTGGGSNDSDSDNDQKNVVVSLFGRKDEKIYMYIVLYPVYVIVLFFLSCFSSLEKTDERGLRLRLLVGTTPYHT